MTSFPQERVVVHVIDALHRLGGLATLEEIEEQLARSGALRLPRSHLDLVVRMFIRANRDGQGLDCFSQSDGQSVELTHPGIG
jgi:hypothetical protein